MARKRNGCPLAGPPERLSGERVCAHTSKCVLINIGRAGQHSGSGWRWEREDSSFHCHLGRKSAGGEGNEPETGWEERGRRLSAEERSRRKGRSQRSTPAPCPTPYPLHFTYNLQSIALSHTLPSFAHTHHGEHHQGSLSLFSPFLFTRLTLIASFCSLAPCLFWSTSRANLKNAFAFHADVGHTGVLYILHLMEVFFTAWHKSYMLWLAAFRHDSYFLFSQYCEKGPFLTDLGLKC